MWIIFGWNKEEKPLGKVATAYCYDCRRVANWVVWNESEWATLSAIRVLKFINKYSLNCDGCAAVFALSRQEFRNIDIEMKRHSTIDGTPIHTDLIKRIEMEQLGGKTELQRRFIQESMQAEKEYREALQKQNQGDT